MYHLIAAQLDRQSKALDLLISLLDEEYELLQARQTEEIMVLEFSIHELLRQILHEKESVVRRLGGGKVRDYAAMLPEEQGAELLRLWQEIDQREQSSSRKASRNTELSLELMDQSKSMLDWLHSRILPPQQDSYGRKGKYIKRSPQAALISGSL